jgi:transposase
MAKPRSRPQLSFETAYIYDDAAGIADDHWSRRFFAQLFCAFDDGEFADLYEDRGRYPVSPSLLAGITILQYMYNVSDRAAVENTIMRRDWRIALGIRADYTGFAPSVLCRFRQRLVAHGRGRMLFETVLGRARELGLLSGRRKLRVDATHVVANVTRLSRAEVVREALRVVVCDAHKRYPELREDGDFGRLHDRYSEEVWIGGGGAVSDEQLRELGRDGLLLLQLVGWRQVRGADVLAQIITENFVVDEGEDAVRVRAPDERPDDRIATPHEPDARYGKKRNHKWLGDQAHVVETADEDRPNLVTDVLSTDPRAEDSTVLEQIAWRARSGTPEVDTLIADGGYASAHNSRAAAQIGVDLIAPPRSNNRKGWLPLEAFELDWERQVAICPQGHQSILWRERQRDLQIRFDTATCAACRRRRECTSSRQGRTLAPSREYRQLQRDRARSQTAQWKALYRRRAAIEGTISELVHCCGLRRSRYRDAPFRALHVLLSATALNVRRILKSLAESPVAHGGAAAASVLSSPLRSALLRPWRALWRRSWRLMTVARHWIAPTSPATHAALGL